MQQLLADAGLLGALNAGTNTGSGMGAGAGNGYSARRSTLQNVGLYGGLPLHDPSSSQGAGLGAQIPPGDGRSASHRSRRDADASAYASDDQLKAAGAGEAVVPLRYRHRVGRYFQRIADEIGEQ